MGGCVGGGRGNAREKRPPLCTFSLPAEWLICPHERLVNLRLIRCQRRPEFFCMEKHLGQNAKGIKCCARSQRSTIALSLRKCILMKRVKSFSVAMWRGRKSQPEHSITVIPLPFPPVEQQEKGGREEKKFFPLHLIHSLILSRRGSSTARDSLTIMTFFPWNRIAGWELFSKRRVCFGTR